MVISDFHKGHVLIPMQMMAILRKSPVSEEFMIKMCDSFSWPWNYKIAQVATGSL